MPDLDPSQYTVMLIDDDPAVRRFLVRVLAGTEYQVVDFGSPKEALEHLRHEAVDIILCDYKMPEMSGTEVLSQARLIQPDNVRMILTGHADVDMAMEAINEGGVLRLMTKPVRPDELIMALRGAVEHLALQRETEMLASTVDSSSGKSRSILHTIPGLKRLLK
jgi:DNA-binding NtrC family response regulator